MPIYRQDADLAGSVAGVMVDLHPHLAEAGLRIDVLGAFPKTNQLGDPIEEALSCHGYPCAAAIKVRGPRDRGQGLGDVLLTIDAHRWLLLDVAEQTAVIDHELTHVELSVSDGGSVKRDDYDRPKLRIRLHDHQFGWFDAVAKRHPVSSLEVQQARRFVDEYGQIYLPGFAPEVTEAKSRRKKAGGPK